MTLHPHEGYVMRLFRLEQALPEVGVFDGLLLCVLPAALEPAIDPMLVESVHHVLRVRMDLDGARTLERLERDDHPEQLHAVVRRGGIPLRELALVQRAL